MTLRHHWVPYKIAHEYEEEAREKGVSKVARSPRGFMRRYEQAGTSSAMKKSHVMGYKQTWGQRREAFINRHLAQYKKHHTLRRWLALMMWAFKAGKKPKA